MRNFISLAVFLILAGRQLAASVSVQLTAPTSTILVGETLQVTATGTDSATANTRFSYQFTVRPHDQGPWIPKQDYYFSNTFLWTPSEQEGQYDIGVTGWSEATKQSGVNYITINVTSRITSGKPVVSVTNNTLVALYSAPPCSAPATVKVQFHAPNTPTTTTPSKTCTGLSLNFYLGGMLANTTYSIQQFLSSSGGIVTGPQVSFTTGSVPSTSAIPPHYRLFGPTPPTSTTYPYLLHSTTGASAYATDLNENIVWYGPGAPPYHSGYITHPISGGTFLLIEDDPVHSKQLCQNVPLNRCGDHQYLREYDMAGNVLRQTSWSILNDEINTLRASQHRSTVRLNYLSHEGIRLPNGYTALLATNEQVKTRTSGVTDVLGDVVVVLDTSWQVVWAWNSYDFLDVNRSTFPSTCAYGALGCPQQYFQKQPNGQPYTQAFDWTHANSIFYDSRDGNLIISLRRQSWVLKVAYGNGTGDGHIIWRLGYGGDFKLAAGYPVTDWFSGQHDAELQANGLLTLFDNKNASTVTQQPGGNARGQAWNLDTVNMIATPTVNIDLGVVSTAVGSATLLSNGNYEWQAGFINGDEAITFEFTPSGTLQYEEQNNTVTYRSFRMMNLYTPQ